MSDIGGFVALGVSLPICWKPGGEYTNSYVRLWWLTFEIVIGWRDYVSTEAHRYVEILSDHEIGDGDDDAIIYFRKSRE